MFGIPHEISIAGVYFSPMLLSAIPGVAAAGLTALLLNRYRLSRFFVYPPLIFVALSILYRLPAGDDPTTLERYKRNGWYNMGLQSLKAGDCRSAQINFKEARGIDPTDSEALLAVEMAKACRYSAGNDAYFREVDALEYRALDD